MLVANVPEHINNDIEEHKNDEPIEFLEEDRTFKLSDYIQVAKSVAVLAFGMDAYGCLVLSLPAIAAHISNDATSTASFSLVVTMLTINTVALSPLYSINLQASIKAGELAELEKQGRKKSPEWEAIRKEIADLHRCGLVICGMLVPVFTGLMVESGSILHYVFAQDKDVAYRAQDILPPLSPMIPAIFLWMNAVQMTTSFNYEKLIIPGVLTLGISMILAVGLGLGQMRMPDLGMKGLIIALNVGAYLIAAIYNYTIYFGKEFKDLKLGHFFAESHRKAV